MKGKLVYTTIVEKEIEIPDEVIEISEKSWFDWTEEEEKKIKTFSENAWNSIEDNIDRVGIYYEENGQDWILEQY